MKNSLILALFILISLPGIGQSLEDGSRILTENGIRPRCINVTDTPQGLIIGTRDNTNFPTNYVYTLENQLKKIDLLNGYTVLDYNGSKNILLVGKYKAGHSDSMFREIYTYNLTTKKFVLQNNTGWKYGSNKFVGNDSITMTSNIKRVGEVGSDLVTTTVNIK